MTHEENDNARLGQLVSGWRKGASFSQTALADALGTQQATISKLESGSYKLTVSQLSYILDVCGLTFPMVADELESVLHADAKPIWERVDE